MPNIRVIGNMRNASKAKKEDDKLTADSYKNIENSEIPTVQVIGLSEVTIIPDRCKLNIQLSSTKNSASEAKASVEKRIEYIFQTLNNHGIKKEDTLESKVLKTKAPLGSTKDITNMLEIGMRIYLCEYTCDYEIICEFTNFNKCQDFCNFITEKLGNTVTILEPEFFITSEKLQTLRRKTFCQAIRDAKLKAAEVAALLKLEICEPTVVKELISNENIKTVNKEKTISRNIQQSISRLAAEKSAVVIEAKVQVTFPINTSKTAKC